MKISFITCDLHYEQYTLFIVTFVCKKKEATLQNQFCFFIHTGAMGLDEGKISDEMDLA